MNKSKPISYVLWAIGLLLLPLVRLVGYFEARHRAATR